jgi:hypothetical protein
MTSTLGCASERWQKSGRMRRALPLLHVEAEARNDHFREVSFSEADSGVASENAQKRGGSEPGSASENTTARPRRGRRPRTAGADRPVRCRPSPEHLDDVAGVLERCHQTARRGYIADVGSPPPCRTRLAGVAIAKRGAIGGAGVRRVDHRVRSRAGARRSAGRARRRARSRTR